MVKKFLNYEFIKDNISIILLIPTALGGFWQIIELAYVGVPYIRFFSISQLVADGLMMSFVIVIVYLTIQITLRDSNQSDRSTGNQIEEVSQPKESTKSVVKKLFIYGSVLALFIFFYCFSLFKEIATKDRLSTLGFCLVIFGVLIVCMFIGIVFRYVSKLVDLKKLGQSKHREWAMAVIGPVTLYCMIKLSVFIIPRVHNSYLLPENFKNDDYINCRIKNLNPNLISYKIAYFNDKYIFVDIELPKKTQKTEVLKFDDFFSDSCILAPAH